MAIQRIAKNVSGGDITIVGLRGITIPDADQVDLILAGFSLDTLGKSDELSTHINAGDIVINDGTDDLSATEALKAISNQSEYGLPTAGAGGTSVFDPETGYPNLQVVDVTVIPTTNLLDGQVISYEGVWYRYDESRSKWLSLSPVNFIFSHKDGVDNKYLKVGDVVTDVTGYTLALPATLTGGMIHCEVNKGEAIKEFYVRKNDVATNLLTMTTADWKYGNTTLNLDFDALDWIQMYCSDINGGVDDPVVVLIFNWRAV